MAILPAYVDSAAPQAADDLRLILDHIEDVVMTVDAVGRLRSINPAGERAFGLHSLECIGQPVSALIPALADGGQLSRRLRRMARATALGSSGDCEALQARHALGYEFPIELTARRVRSGRRDVYVLCVRDVTARRRAAQVLTESEDRYRSLIDHAPEAILVLDVDTGMLIDANAKAEKLYRMTRPELLTRPAAELMPVYQEDGRLSADVVRTHVQRTIADDPQTFECLICTGDGGVLPCEVRLSRMPHALQRLLRCSVTDIAARKRSEQVAAGGRLVLERVAARAPLSLALDAIAKLVEVKFPGSVGGVSVLSVDGTVFDTLVAPALDESLHAMLDRCRIGLRQGSCAAAVHLGRPVFAGTLLDDPYWQSRADALHAAGFRSVWSVPVSGGSGKIVGALCVLRHTTGLPEGEDIESMADAAQLAGIAIEHHRAEQALRGSEAKFRGLYETIMEGVYQSTPDGRLTSVNPAFVRILGYDSAEEMYALPTASMLYWNPNERAEFSRRVESGGELHNGEFRLRRRDGMQIVVLESARVVRDRDDRVVAYEGTIADITARKRAEEASAAEKERAQVTLQSIGDAVITTDAAGCIDYMNPVAEQLTGWTLAEVCGQPLDDTLQIVHDTTRERLPGPLLRSANAGAPVGPGDQSVLIDRHGNDIAVQESAAPIRDRTGALAGAVVVLRDVGRERRLRRALAYQAAHDALTGLINRREFDQRMQAALESARATGTAHAFLYIDLDQFKIVNDTCGHSAGDRLIREITGLVQTRVRVTDVLARLGGDEFGVLLQNTSIEQAAGIAESVRQSIRDYRFQWGASTMSVGASIGAVEITAETDSVATIMSAADVACYTAKERGRNRTQMYEAGSGRSRHREMHWVAQVTRAVEDNRLELLFQSIHPVHGDPRLSFHELTVRMRSESGEIVQPGDFIPAAERYNVMSRIDLWVLREAVQFLRNLPPQMPLPLLAVNVSGNSLSEENYLEHVLDAVGDSALTRALCFEITETAAVTNLESAVTFIKELRARGCRFSLDDFGSGLSSFRYLKNLPVDFLKIDGSFVSNVATDAVDRSMVQAIAQVGRTLGMATVAEKVESADVLAELDRIGVDFAQGFHLARPLPMALFPVTPFEVDVEPAGLLRRVVV